MSTIVKDQAEESANYIKILNSIDSDRSILLFPVRLETHRRRSKTIHCSRDGSQTARNVSTNELLVRIFPDEVELDYYDDRLTEQQISDGKHFWLQWFIASGNQKREYEAQDGTKKSVFDIVANDVEFLTTKPKETELVPVDDGDLPF